MKIIQITAAYKPAYIYGGPTMSVARLCEAIVEAGAETEVFTTTANGKTALNVEANKQHLIDNVPVTYFKRITKDHTHFSPILLWGLRREILYYKKNLPSTPSVIKKETNDKLLIHIHAWWNLVSILSCWLAKLYNIPVVLSPRGMLTDYTLSNSNAGFKSIIHSLAGKNLLKYCHIHATSEKEKGDILKFIAPKSITVISNLVELDKEEPSLPNKDWLNNKTNQPQNDSTFKLIFLSRIEEKKGLALLFEALAKFNVDWNLTIAGSGEDKYVENLKQKAEWLKLIHIDWIGQVKNEAKFKLLADHNLMVLTSYNENFANVVVESLSVGTPVLLSNQVGLADYVLKKNLGWVTDLNVNNIKEKLDLAYLNVAIRQNTRQNGAQHINVDFNDSVLVKEYINLYECVIK